MATGKVLRLVQDRGFGFIKVDGRTENRGEIFFHRSQVGGEPGFSFDAMVEGMEVQFTIGDSEKGPRAENITRA